MSRAPAPTLTQDAYPTSVSNVASWLAHIPGVGRKTAERYALWLASAGGAATRTLLGEALTKMAVVPCHGCNGLAERDQNGSAVCAICRHSKRDSTLLCVVAKVQDMLALERCGVMRGRYFVLGRLLSPLEGINADELPLDALDAKVTPGIEVLLALPATVDGNATSLLIAARLAGKCSKVTRIASGMPHGGDLEFADPVTLGSAIGGRVAM